MYGYKMFDNQELLSKIGGLKYEVGVEYEVPQQDVSLAVNGHHFCIEARNCMEYANLTNQARFFQVLVKGRIINNGMILVASNLTLGREITWQEWKYLCTGYFSSCGRFIKLQDGLEHIRGYNTSVKPKGLNICAKGLNIYDRTMFISVCADFGLDRIWYWMEVSTKDNGYKIYGGTTSCISRSSQYWVYCVKDIDYKIVWIYRDIIARLLRDQAPDEKILAKRRLLNVYHFTSLLDLARDLYQNHVPLDLIEPDYVAIHQPISSKL